MVPRGLIVTLCLLLSLPLAAKAEVVGTSRPAESLTRTRIEQQLPPDKREAWLDYLDRSEHQRAADRAALASERKGLNPIPPVPKESNSARSVPMDRDPAWYGSEEAQRLARTILSFQTPAGGWSKNLDLSGSPRARGQSFTPNNLSRHLSEGDFDAPADPDWNYVGTIDNDATTTELRFLALVSSQVSGPAGKPFRAAYIRGIEYLLRAQYPNGGWPQVWPLEGGYHDAITFNDNALIQSAAVLTQVAAHRVPWVCEQDHSLCQRAAAAVSRAIQLILAAQVRVNGKLTAWAQQHDPLTLAPVAGRNYEPAALCTGESADTLLYLMSMPNPSPEIRAAITAGVEWLRRIEIHGYAWSGSGRDTGGRTLVAAKDAGPIWPRFISIETGKPIFGDRDKTIHDTVTELSLERRNGYAWYGSNPKAALDAYEKWSSW